MAFTEQQQILFSQSIFDCLLKSELLAAELTGAARFDRSLLKRPPIGTRLNFEQKLGHLFEDAFAATIDAADDLSLIGRNVQLPGSDGQTLGEMDFLILNVPRQQPIHLELAVKFYLAHEDAQGTMQFPGPDARDNWPRKLKRLTSHQLRLTDLPAVRSLLLEQFEIKPPEVAHIIYGCLFDHIDALPATDAPAISAGCRRGRWLYASEIESLRDATNTITIIPKALWPVQISDQLRTTLPACSVSQLVRAAQNRCVMFSTPELPQSMFLVPDDWPASIR